MEQKRRVALFDVDGTLTKPRNKIEQPMIDALEKLKSKAVVAVVGGSDKNKVEEQLTKEVCNKIDWFFSENGLYAIKQGQFYQKRSLKDELGEEKLKKFINFCLKYLADIDIPIKRGTFIEYRNAMINISPIGRNCSQEERDEFEKYDLVHKIREKFINTLKENFKEYNFSYAIGGQISFDVVPVGWDKTYSLQFLEGYDEIHFFGDKTFPGGNDYEIYIDKRVIGHSVKSYQETIKLLEEIFHI